MNAIPAVYYENKIIPLPASKLKVGNYYRAILTDRLVRITRIEDGFISFTTTDKEGDIYTDNVFPHAAEGMFYDDGQIMQ